MPLPFQKIIVAYDDSPTAHDALGAGIELCKPLGTSLQTITVIEPYPVYTEFVVTVAPDVAQGIEADRKRHYKELLRGWFGANYQFTLEETL